MAFKCFIRFVLAQAAVSHGMELLLALITVDQGMVSTIMKASGLSNISDMTIPAEMVTIIENVGFLESIPLWGRYPAGVAGDLGAVSGNDPDGVLPIFQGL